MNAIFHRISIRKFKKQPVEEDKILQILRAGMQAPSACNQQPWEFYVVTAPDKIQKLSQVTPYAGCAAGAPVVIVPVYRKENLPALPMVPIDMGIALENTWLETDVSLRFRNGWNRFIRFWNCRRMWKLFPYLRWGTPMKNGHSRNVLIRTGFTLWNELQRFAFAQRSGTMKAPVGLLSDRTVLRQQDGGASPRQVRV